MDKKKQFHKAFANKDYKNAYLNFIQFNKEQSETIENFDEYLKISTGIFDNLDKYSEEELIKKARQAANMMQNFLVQTLCLLALMKNPKNPEIFYIWAKFALEYDYLWEAEGVIIQTFDLEKPEHPEKYLQLAAKVLFELYNYEDLNKKQKNILKKMILEYIKSAKKSAPNDIETYRLLIKYYTLDFSDADEKIIKIWNKIIKLEPDNGWFYSSRGGIKRQMNNYKGAIADYKKAIKYGDRDYMTYRELAEIYYFNNQAQKALKLYQNAIKEYENNPEMQKEMLIGLATVYQWQMKFKKAEEIYTSIIEKFPDDIRIYTMRADVRLYTENYEGGVSDADFVLSKNNPDYTLTYLSKANCLDKLKKHEEAIVCCDKVIEVYPDYFGAYLNKSLSLCNLEQYDKALECIEKAIELNKDYSDGYVQRGYVKFYMKDYDGAFKDIDKGLKVDKTNFHAHRIKAFFYYILGDIKKALKHINIALEVNKNTPYQIQEYFLRHKIYKQLGKDKKAQQDYDKTFELEPDFDIDEFEKTLKI